MRHIMNTPAPAPGRFQKIKACLTRDRKIPEAFLLALGLLLFVSGVLAWTGFITPLGEQRHVAKEMAEVKEQLDQVDRAMRQPREGEVTQQWADVSIPLKVKITVASYSLEDKEKKLMKSIGFGSAILGFIILRLVFSFTPVPIPFTLRHRKYAGAQGSDLVHADLRALLKEQGVVHEADELSDNTNEWLVLWANAKGVKHAMVVKGTHTAAGEFTIYHIASKRKWAYLFALSPTEQILPEDSDFATLLPQLRLLDEVPVPEATDPMPVCAA